MRHIIAAVLISSLILFIVILLINAIGFMPSESVLQLGWITWGVLTILCYPLAKKVMM